LVLLIYFACYHLFSPYAECNRLCILCMIDHFVNIYCDE
jgi:hypothetical protein